MSQTIVTAAPTWEPVSLADMKLHLRVDGDDEDALIWQKMVAAREGAERRTGQTLPTQSLELHLNSWPQDGVIALAAPFDPTSVIVTYRDARGASHTLDPSTYVVTASSIWPINNQRWPYPTAPSDAATIAYTAGYANADAIPSGIKEWIKAEAAMLYETRENQSELGPLGLSVYRPHDVLLVGNRQILVR